MPDTIKNVYLKKKIDGAVVTIYPHSDAGVVSYTKGSGQDAVTTTVAAELASLATNLASVSTETAVKQWIADADTALYNRIMGLTGEEGETISEAYDTLKEVADYLAGDNGAAATLARLAATIETPNTGLSARMTAAETAITNINTTIGADDTTGLRARIKAAEDDIDTNEAAITGINTAIGDDATADSIKGRIKATEDDIDALETAVGDDDTVGSIKGRIKAAEDDIDALKTTVGDANSGLVKDVADNASDIADINTAIGDDTTAGSIKGRIAAIENHNPVTVTSTEPTVATAEDDTLYIVFDE